MIHLIHTHGGAVGHIPRYPSKGRHLYWCLGLVNATAIVVGTALRGAFAPL